MRQQGKDSGQSMTLRTLSRSSKLPPRKSGEASPANSTLERERERERVVAGDGRGSSYQEMDVNISSALQHLSDFNTGLQERERERVRAESEILLFLT